MAPRAARQVSIGIVCVALMVLAACRPPTRREVDAIPPAHPAGPVTGVARGATLYAAYCAGCHGSEGRGDGPVAATIGMRPTDIGSAQRLAQVSDRAILDRLIGGDPLRADSSPTIAEELLTSSLIDYIPTISGRDWSTLRAGRIVYEGACAPCHGAYGNGEGVLSGLNLRQPADLAVVRDRYTDAALGQIARRGLGAMSPMSDTFEPGEARALVAYVRLLSKGYRLYDTYCAGCHGDDGRGVHPEDRLRPATVAPELGAEQIARLGSQERLGRVLHMVRRERGMMPHFRDWVTEGALREIIEYLRAQGSLAGSG